MSEKICTKCGELKEFSAFYKKGDRKVDRYHSRCKDCIKSYTKARYKENPALTREQARRSYWKHLEVNKKRKSDYRKRNRDDLNKKYTKYMNSCPQRLLNRRVSHIFRLVLIGKVKKSAVFDYLPYSEEDFRAHMESLFEDWMTWENYGKKGWSIEHIVEKRKFTYSSMEDEAFRQCWALSNLKPLCCKENSAGAGRMRRKVDDE